MHVQRNQTMHQNILFLYVVYYSHCHFLFKENSSATHLSRALCLELLSKFVLIVIIMMQPQ